jgi:pimeloyl-ACP methyl ester carboxylesterase
VPTFMSDDVQIAYEVIGDGEPILLIHGFASNARVNWHSTGWVDLLEKSGRQVITIDNRGHGKSQKLYDPARYTSREMALDSSRLIEYLGHRHVDIMGYSMGARLTALLGIHHAEQARSLVIAGLAGNMISGVGGGEEIAAALRAPSADKVKDATARGFRQFAEQTKSDLEALANCISSHRETVSPEQLATIKAPALVVAGEDDDIAGAVSTLVDEIPGAEGVVLTGRDHMKAVGDKTFKLSVLDFLDRRP